jgi:hypothetical protein
VKKSLICIAVFAIIGLAFAVGQLTAEGQQPALSVMHAPDPVSLMAAPLATAPQTVARIQWEYKTVQSNTGDLPGDQLDQLGNDGWELCGVRQRGQAATFFYFKREKLARDGNQSVRANAVPTPMDSPQRNLEPGDPRPAFEPLSSPKSFSTGTPVFRDREAQ